MFFCFLCAALTDFAVLFNDASVHKYLVDNVKRIGYAKPTPLQKHAIPHEGNYRLQPWSNQEG